MTKKEIFGAGCKYLVEIIFPPPLINQNPSLCGFFISKI